MIALKESEWMKNENCKDLVNVMIHCRFTNLLCFSCDQLLAQNNQLRQQLVESHHTNESLTNDLQKLTNDWESLRDEMLAKEDEWKCEEEVRI